MPIFSSFSFDLIRIIKSELPDSNNTFLLKYKCPDFLNDSNIIADSSLFNVDYINQHYRDFDHIFIHYMFLHPHDLMRLKDEAARKIVWVVWGDDLYHVKKRFEKAKDTRELIRNSLYVWSDVSIIYKLIRRIARHKVRLFQAIGIGYAYDKLKAQELFGEKPPIVYAPYFSLEGSMAQVQAMREAHLCKSSDVYNVLVGHNGFPYHEHESSLKLLSKFKNENIHINLVLSYGASEEKAKAISETALNIFGEKKVTILTEKLSKKDYFMFLSTMDAVVFPFTHQAALGNARRLAYCGVKLYLNPNGVLAKGFLMEGVKTDNYFDIQNQSWDQFCSNTNPVNINAPLFAPFDYDYNVETWKQLLER